ncbi:MAG: hypothetical protein HYV52_01450 [Parcubacteria group bacterium]|nr:hypothetical protein [Parcubacteria group bacterium]
MTTKTLDKKTRKLESELDLLRSFVIGQAGQDSEGEYNPDFAQRILKAAKEKPNYEFKNIESFLRHVREKKSNS